VLDAVAGTATQIDPLRNVPGSSIGLGPDPSSIAVGLGSAWVSDGEDGNLYRIDPELARATPIPLGAPLAVVAIDEAERSVWVELSPTPDRPLSSSARRTRLFTQQHARHLYHFPSPASSYPITWRTASSPANRWSGDGGMWRSRATPTTRAGLKSLPSIVPHSSRERPGYVKK
jgi:hypothetical protein